MALAIGNDSGQLAEGNTTPAYPIAMPVPQRLTYGFGKGGKRKRPPHVVSVVPRIDRAAGVNTRRGDDIAPVRFHVEMRTQPRLTTDRPTGMRKKELPSATRQACARWYRGAQLTHTGFSVGT